MKNLTKFLLLLSACVQVYEVKAQELHSKIISSSSQNSVVLVRSDNSGDQNENQTSDIDFQIWDSNTRLNTPQGRIGMVGVQIASQAKEASGRMAFYTTNEAYPSPSLLERMRIDHNGNVGIGTTTPSYAKLQIRGGGTHQLLAICRPNNDVPALYLGNDGTNNAVIASNNSDLKFGKDLGNVFTEHVRLKASTGFFGIGISDPNVRLEIKDELRVRLASNHTDKNVARIVPIGFSGITGAQNWALRGGYQYSTGIAHNSVGGDLDLIKSLDRNIILATKTDGTSLGNVGIGTTTPDSKLTVAGNVHAQEVKVTVNAGADFVFDDSYQLPTIGELDAFIKANKHLPEIAAAIEMETDGLELGKMNIKLLQKIEELTLYTIEQDKQLKLQKNRIEELETENKKQKDFANQLTELNNRILKLELKKTE